MPYWKPASLTEEETWDVTAFLLQENNLWIDSEELTASNADLILVSTPLATTTPQPPLSSTATSWTLSPFHFTVGFILLILLLLLQKLLRKK